VNSNEIQLKTRRRWKIFVKVDASISTQNRPNVTLGAFEAVIGTFAVAAIASGVAGRTRRIVGSVVIGSAFGTTGADVTRIALALAVSGSTPTSLTLPMQAALERSARFALGSVVIFGTAKFGLVDAQEIGKVRE